MTQENERQVPRLELEAVLTTDTAETLDDLMRKQLLIACSAWDGMDLSLEERFIDPNTTNDPEPCLVGELAICQISNLDGPDYVAYILGRDSATIFEAGTTKVVGGMIQFGVESPDKPLEEALQSLLRRIPEPTQL